MGHLEELLVNDFLSLQNLTVERAAILLSMTTSRESENTLREYLKERGFTCGVTEIAGKASDVSEKLFHHVLGAALHLGVLEKTPHNVHALVHATHEACIGINFDMWLNTNYRLKVTIVRKDTWLVVVFNGFAATHPISNHHRIGLGAMHI